MTGSLTSDSSSHFFEEEGERPRGVGGASSIQGFSSLIWPVECATSTTADCQDSPWTPVTSSQRTPPLLPGPVSILRPPSAGLLGLPAPWGLPLTSPYVLGLLLVEEGLTFQPHIASLGHECLSAQDHRTLVPPRVRQLQRRDSGRRKGEKNRSEVRAGSRWSLMRELLLSQSPGH